MGKNRSIAVSDPESEDSHFRDSPIAVTRKIAAMTKFLRRREEAGSGLRIIQVVNTLATTDGGPARNAYDLHRALDTGVSNRLAWMHGERSGSLLPERSDQHDRFLWAANEPNGVRRILTSLITSDVVILHGYYLWWSAPVALFGKLVGSTVLLTPHGALTSYQQQFSRLKKALFELTAGWLLRACVDEFVTGSDRERMEFLKRFPRSRVSVVGVGTDLGTSPLAATAWAEPLRLISVSRISQKKRLDLLIEAVRVLADDGVSVKLIIAGSGDAGLQAALASLAARLGVTERVDFIGLQDSDQLRALYSNADIFVSPSDDENFGISAVESMAAGIPVVVSNAVDSMHGVTGPFIITLADRSPVSIAEAIKSMSERDRTVVVQEAYEASKRFGWKSVADRWTSIGRRLRASHD